MGNLNEVELPYIAPKELLMTAGKWNGVSFPASSIEPAAKELVDNPNATVRLFVGASRDHEDSSGTLVGEVKNFVWESPTLYGDLCIIREDTARMVKYGKERNAKLFGISPRMDTSPSGSPRENGIERILKFRSFGIVIDPAQGEQAMLAKDEKGRPVLHDGPYIVVDSEDSIEEELTKEGVDILEKKYCEKCEVLFEAKAEKCDKCGGELKKADDATVKRLEEKAKKTKGQEEKPEDEKPEEEKPKDKEDNPKDKKEYPEPTFKKKPYYKASKQTQRRPYYSKEDGSYFMPSVNRLHTFYRAMALGEVNDMGELTADLVGLCGDIVKRHDEGGLDVSEALSEMTEFMGEIPLSAELSKKEINVAPFVVELMKDKAEGAEKLLDAEIEKIEGDKKLPPALRDDVKTILMVPGDVVLSEDGSATDVAGAFRRIVDALPEEAFLSFEEKTKNMVPTKDTKLPEEKDLRKLGEQIVTDAGRAKKK